MTLIIIYTICAALVTRSGRPGFWVVSALEIPQNVSMSHDITIHDGQIENGVQNDYVISDKSVEPL